MPQYNFRISRPVDARIPEHVLRVNESRRDFEVDPTDDAATVDAWLASEAELDRARADGGAGLGRRDLEWVLEDLEDVQRRTTLVMKRVGDVEGLEVAVSVWNPPSEDSDALGS